jgi:hypothetical protein
MAARAQPKVVTMCLVGALLGGAGCVVGARELVAQLHLQRESVQTEARVTDARSGRQYGGGSRELFELRYAFTVPGRSETFTLEDVSGSNLWATMDDRSQWQSALDTGMIGVRYWPPNPRVNQVVRRNGIPVGDASAIIVLGVVLAIVSLRIGWLEVTGKGDHWRQVWRQIRHPKG